MLTSFLFLHSTACPTMNVICKLLHVFNWVTSYWALLPNCTPHFKKFMPIDHSNTVPDSSKNSITFILTNQDVVCIVGWVFASYIPELHFVHVIKYFCVNYFCFIISVKKTYSKENQVRRRTKGKEEKTKSWKESELKNNRWHNRHSLQFS